MYSTPGVTAKTEDKKYAVNSAYKLHSVAEDALGREYSHELSINI
jgi:hypothetical protein